MFYINILKQILLYLYNISRRLRYDPLTHQTDQLKTQKEQVNIQRVFLNGTETKLEKGTPRFTLTLIKFTILKQTAL